MKIREEVTGVITELFPLFLENPAKMPSDWAKDIAAAGSDRTMLARIVSDYISGMTDRFALQEYERLIGDASHGNATLTVKNLTEKGFAMLDSQTQSNLSKPAGVLQGTRIMVLGACCGLGRSMTRSLNESGAQVIAVDTNLEALKTLEDVVAVPLRGDVEGALHHIGRKWGETRLDAVVNLMPLKQPGMVDLNIKVLQAIVQGFMPALTIDEGQIVTVVGRPEQALDVGTGAMVPALASTQSALASALRRDGLLLNMISFGEAGIAPACTATIGLLSKSLGSITGNELYV